VLLSKILEADFDDSYTFDQQEEILDSRGYSGYRLMKELNIYLSALDSPGGNLIMGADQLPKALAIKIVKEGIRFDRLFTAASRSEDSPLLLANLGNEVFQKLYKEYVSWQFDYPKEYKELYPEEFEEEDPYSGAASGAPFFSSGDKKRIIELETRVAGLKREITTLRNEDKRLTDAFIELRPPNGRTHEIEYLGDGASNNSHLFPSV
jgi:hypothetical protein